MNVNKAFVIGNLTRDPELRNLPSGKPVVSFAIATNRIWTNQSGEKQQDTQFHNIVAFGRQAEIVKQYLNKGSLVFIEGRLQTKNWEAQDGSRRSRTEIVTERLQLGPRRVPSSPDQSVGSLRQVEDETRTPQKADVGKESESLDTIEYPEENNNPDEIPF